MSSNFKGDKKIKDTKIFISGKESSNLIRCMGDFEIEKDENQSFGNSPNKNRIRLFDETQKKKVKIRCCLVI